MDPPQESGDLSQTEEPLPVEQGWLYRTAIERTPIVTYIDVYETADSSAEAPIFVSPQIEVLLGYTPSEWLSDPNLWRDSIHPDDRGWVTETAFDSKEAFSAEYRMIRKDGHSVWIHEMASIVRDYPTGRSLWHGVMMDITERKEAEAQKDLQARLLQSISDAVISCDRNMVITSWNRAAQQLYGWTAEEAVGRPMREVLRSEMVGSDDDDHDARDPFGGEAGLAWRGLAVQYCKAGDEVYVETKGLPLRDAEGQVTGYVMVNREVAG